MKNLTKRGLSWLLVLALCISLVSGLGLTASASSYSKGNWIKNSGSRGTVATVPSGYAADFYGEKDYDYFADNFTGSSTVSNVPSSTLYAALKTFMTEKQVYTTGYSETNDMYQYTDCQNGGGAVSAFYSGTLVGPSWEDQTPGWNKEHTWPNSKGDDSGEGENDIMMLRPALSANNSSRGNKAYGVGSNYYDPNSESNGTLNIRGDVARILLYVYTRWGNTGSMWGTDGVIESADVLLQWMEEDPVDTWELGRNDSVQSITGARNIFVDYPELAFVLFDRQIPVGMTTPSGGGSDAVPATVIFSENGVPVERSTYEDAVIILPQPVTVVDEEYSFVGWVDTTVDRTDTKPVDIHLSGTSYTVPEGGSVLYALYTSYEGVAERTNTLADGQTVILVNGNRALSHEVINNYYKGSMEVAVEGNTVPVSASILWNVAASGSGFTLANASGNKLSMNDSNSSLPYDDTNDIWAVRASATSDRVYVVNTATQKRICWSSKYNNFSAYNTEYSDYVEGNDDLQIFRVTGVDYYSTTAKKAVTYTVSYSVPKGYGFTAPASQECNKLGIKLPVTDAPQGYTFVGWVKSSVEETSDKPVNIYYAGDTFHTEEAVTLKALYSKGESTWTLVTSVSSLAAGDKLVIAATATNKAMSTNQKASNRGETDITKSGNTITWTVNDVQELTLESGSLANTWSFNTGSGYLAANGSGSSNYLKTVAQKDKYASFTIEIASSGVANVKGQGGNERNWMRYNTTSSLFACYKSGQSDICLYKLSGNMIYTTEIPDAACEHSFTAETVADKYLKSGATCTAQAVYYKSCAACGELPEELTTAATFQAGELADHSYTVDQHNESQHWQKCANCNATTTKEDHKGGTATCTQQAECSVCGTAYGTTAAHSYTKWKISTEDHVKQCANCAAVDETTREAHKGGTSTCQAKKICTVCEGKYGELAAHAYTKQEAKAEYLKSAATCTAKAVYWKSCSACGLASATETFESGELAAHKHTVLQSDKDGHWYKCENCDDTTAAEAHKGGTATCTEQPVCSVCEKAYDSALGHGFTTGKFQKVDGEYHAQKCSRCDVLDIENKAEHSGGTATCQAKKKCTACEAEYGELGGHNYTEKVDAQYLKAAATCTSKTVYWKSCSTCGLASDTETFQYGETAYHDFTFWQKSDDEHWLKCQNCDAVKDDSKEAHDYAAGYGHNGEKHWKTCKCGLEGTKEAHKGGEATCTEAGVCSVCAREYIPATGHAGAQEIPEVSATCTKPGVKKHYHCDSCNADYLDKLAAAKPQSEKDLAIAIDPKAHPAEKLASVEAVAAGCHSGTGYRAYSYCLDCEVMMLSDGTVVESAEQLIVAPKNQLEKVSEVKPTSKKEGMKAHWFCQGCGKYYADAEGKTEVIRESLIIPKVETPVTGDGTAVYLCIALAILAGAGIVAILIFKKRKAA